MSFFGKIKENFNHGGIKVNLQAPASVSMQDATLPVTVSITAGEEQQTINSVSVEIIAQTQNKAFDTSNMSNNIDTAPAAQQHVVARSDYNQAFTIMPGETKSIPVNIVMNQGNFAKEQLPEGSGMAQVAGAFQKLQAVSEAMNGTSYVYAVQATVQIEGIKFGASHQQPIQILKPGEIGTAFQGKIGI